MVEMRAMRSLRVFASVSGPSGVWALSGDSATSFAYCVSSSLDSFLSAPAFLPGSTEGAEGVGREGEAGGAELGASARKAGSNTIWARVTSMIKGSERT